MAKEGTEIPKEWSNDKEVKRRIKGMKGKKKLKIIGVPWHLGHQFDLINALEDYADFYLIESNVRYWTEYIRTKPKNLHFVKWYDPAENYDLAILHLDQQCSHPRLGKSMLFNDLNKSIKDIPKIIINHGTPMIPEYGYEEDVVINGGAIFDDKKRLIKIEGIKNMVGDSFMIVNSYRAMERWGWGYPIWHGKDPDEMLDLPKEPRVVCFISAGGMDKYYNRKYFNDVKVILRDEYGITLWQITVDWKMDMDKANFGFNAYKDYLGRSLIYFNPTKDAPMPRSRAEAMLSGCAIVTTANHDEDLFIENGVNGFIVPDNSPRAVAELLAELLGERKTPETPEGGYYKVLIEIGQRGKETAKKEFSRERYRKEWIKVIDTVLKKGTKEAGKELYGEKRKELEQKRAGKKAEESSRQNGKVS